VIQQLEHRERERERERERDFRSEKTLLLTHKQEKRLDIDFAPDEEIHTLKGEVSFSITEVCKQTNKTE